MAKRAFLLLGILFVVSVPVFLVSSTVLWEFNEPRLYSYGFEKYDIPTLMFMSTEDLERVAAQLRDYFNNDRELINVQYAGHPFFSEREVTHLRDVKLLLNRVKALRWVALALTLGATIAGFAMKRDAFAPQLARLAMWAGGLTLGVLLLAGLGFFIDFGRLFILFHQLSFSNDFWQLDPLRDNLIRMFPEGFWNDAAMLIVLITVIEALLLTAIGFGAGFIMRRFALDETAAVKGPS